NPPPAVQNLDLPVRIYSGNSPDALTGFGGELGATIDVLTRDLDRIAQRLSAVAERLAPGS
ncbi:MAG: hypothetical protein ACO3CS_16120, partial [Alphaproteobacteria bacterium]